MMQEKDRNIVYEEIFFYGFIIEQENHMNWHVKDEEEEGKLARSVLTNVLSWNGMSIKVVK